MKTAENILPWSEINFFLRNKSGKYLSSSELELVIRSSESRSIELRAEPTKEEIIA